MSEANRIPVYTSAAPPVPSSAHLRATIPGWGVDLDPADRPAHPRERHEDTGAHWDLPEPQGQTHRRERSIEHQMLPPVFGTAVPLKGLSGIIRRLAYRRFSEARAAHWLLLMGADRVDAAESHLRSLLTTRPDNPVTQTGLRTEARHDGPAARKADTRADTRHQWLDPVIVAGPWVVAAGGVIAVLRMLRKRTRTKP